MIIDKVTYTCSSSDLSIMKVQRHRMVKSSYCSRRTHVRQGSRLELLVISSTVPYFSFQLFQISVIHILKHTFFFFPSQKTDFSARIALGLFATQRLTQPFSFAPSGHMLSVLYWLVTFSLQTSSPENACAHVDNHLF